MAVLVAAMIGCNLTSLRRKKDARRCIQYHTSDFYNTVLVSKEEESKKRKRLRRFKNQSQVFSHIDIEK